VERLVAIKRPHAERPAALASAASETTERFLEEARITAQVHHANVASMHQAGTDDDGYYLVFDYVEGESLGELIERARLRGERVPTAIVLRITLDALAGLHAAHETRSASGEALGILHRDVSPQNLLVGRDGVTRLTDFGIAKSAASSVVTDQRYVRGKFVYMAPEYLQRLPVDRTLDVYAMGVTLWTALQGAAPWESHDEMQLVQSILLDGVPELPDAPPALTELVATACSRDAGKRFQTARQMLDAIEAVRGAISAPGEIATHIDVAEYVERVAGPDLERRRQATARAPSPVAPKARPAEGSTTELHWQSAEPASDGGVGRGLPPTTDVRRRWEGRSPLWTVGSVAIALLVVGFGFVIATRSGGRDGAQAGAAAAPAGTTHRSPATAPVPSTAPSVPEEPAAPAVREADAGTPLLEQPVPAPTKKKRALRARPAGSAPFLPFSPANPYR
jgi:hypothetical protein